MTDELNKDAAVTMTAAATIASTECRADYAVIAAREKAGALRARVSSDQVESLIATQLTDIALGSPNRRD